MQLDVLFRSCDHQGDPLTLQSTLGGDAAEVALRCFASLLQAISRVLPMPQISRCLLTVIDDHSSSAYLAQVQAMIASAGIQAQMLAMVDEGPEALTTASLNLARQHAPGLIYFADANQLHEPDALVQMILASQYAARLWSTDPCIIPRDESGDYQESNASQVILHAQRYWRTNHHHGGSMLITHAILDCYWSFFCATPPALGANMSAAADQLQRAIPCLSPMPALSIQVPHGLGAPLVDWSALWSEAATWVGPRLLYTAPDVDQITPEQLPAPIKPSQLLAGYKLKHFLGQPISPA